MPASRDILLQTEDLEKAAGFYQKHLGLTRFMDEPNIIGLAAGDLRLYLDRDPSYGPVLEFFVMDLQQAKADLIAAGCHIDQDDPSIPRCYVRDPFGLIFNLAQAKR